jgi:hypothetical protein
VKAHCINGHPYNENDNRQFRQDGTYACRSCNRERQRYYNALRRGDDVSKPHARAAERIADLLLIDGGWLSCPGIAVALGLTEDAVKQALYRMRRAEIFEERVVEMAATVRGQVERRREWRHSQAREAWAS